MRWNKIDITGWGRALYAKVEIARPERQSALSDLMATSPAPAIGQLRSYGDVALNDGGKSIDITRLDRIISFDSKTGIVEVEAGVQIGDLGRSFAGRGWIPPVMPGTGFATVGGCIANDVHGKNHHVVGSFGQHLVDITLLQGDKRKVVSLEKTPELFKATVGGMGQTGIIASARIQLMTCKGDMMVLTERRIDGWDEFIAALDTSTADYNAGWLDATATGDAMGRGILEESEITSGISPTTGRAAAVPFNAPHWALSAPIVKLHNIMRFRRVPAGGRTTVKPITAPFFPLDAIHNWNKLYGKRGFHQFQCIVPIDQVAALRRMMTMISNSGLASPLAVLKRMGDGHAGYMSFPMGGYNLAVDFPNRDRARAMISELEQITESVGGRIYFAKDSLSTPDHIETMYPDQQKWARIVAKADPDGAMTTDLVRRLNLRKIS